MKLIIPKDETGATMVEASMGLVLLLLFLGVVIDFGLALYQFTYLNYSTTRAAREISARIATGSSCADVSRLVETYARKDLSLAISSSDQASWSWCIVGAGQSDCLQSKSRGQILSLKLEGKLPLSCYLLCALIPSDWAISSTVTAAIDNPRVSLCEGKLP